MARHPGLVRRGARYYVRVRIPTDLVDTIGRSEVWKALHTADHREALRRYFPARAELQKAFDEARRRRAANGKLAGEEALHIVRAWFRAIDRKAAEVDFGSFEDDVRAALAEAEQDVVDLMEGAAGESVHAALDRALIAAGWPARPHVVGSIATRRVKVADVDGHAPAELHDLVRRALIELGRRRRERLRGGPNGLSFDPLFANAAVAQAGATNRQDGGLTVGELIAKFSAERAAAITAKTVLDYGLTFRALRELWGDAKPVREITRSDCRQVRDLFAALPSNAEKRFPGKPLAKVAEHAKAKGIAPMHPRTANKHVYRVSTLLKWAHQEEFIAANPALGLRVSAPKGDPRDARRALSTDQLQRIFNAPLYTGCQDDRNGYNKPGPKVIRRGRFWVPLICTFAGLRMGEACQLGVDDVTTEHGVDVIVVRPDPEAGTRLKTASARRSVPIHAELIRCGFLPYVEGMRNRGEVRLFPELPRDRRGSYAGHFQRWANRLLENCDAKGDRQSFHSLRHSFTDALRRAGATGEVIDGLCGWSRENMRDRYGSGPWVKMLDQVMQRVEYEGLDLSHLYVRG